MTDNKVNNFKEYICSTKIMWYDICTLFIVSKFLSAHKPFTERTMYNAFLVRNTVLGIFGYTLGLPNGTVWNT